MNNSRPIILRSICPLLFALIGDWCIAQGIAVPGMYLPPKGPCGADKLKECLRKGDVEAYKKEEERLIKECFGEPQSSPQTAISETAPPVPKKKSAVEVGDIASTGTISGCERLRGFFIATQAGQTTYSRCDKEKTAACNCLSTSLKALGINANSSTKDKAMSYFFVHTEDDIKRTDVAPWSRADRTWYYENQVDFNASAHQFFVATLTRDQLHVHSAEHVRSCDANFSGSLDDYRMVTTVASICYFDETASVVYYSSDNHRAVVKGVYKNAPYVVCVDEFGSAMFPVELSDEVRTAEFIRAQLDQKSGILRKILSEWVAGGNLDTIVECFEGAISVRDIARPDEAWRGMSQVTNYSASNLNILCNSGRAIGPAFDNVKSEKADWVGRVRGLSGPWMAILAAVAPMSHVWCNADKLVALVVTPNGEDLYQLIFNGDGSKPLCKPVLGLLGFDPSCVKCMAEDPPPKAFCDVCPACLDCVVDTLKKANRAKYLSKAKAKDSMLVPQIEQLLR